MRYRDAVEALEQRRLVRGHSPLNWSADLHQCIERWWGNNLRLVVSRPRTSKLGDFRFDQKTQMGVISINEDLSAFECLITLAHELAHAHTRGSRPRREPPHGRHWKTTFGQYLVELSRCASLPDELRNALYSHASSPLSSHTRDLTLMEILGREKNDGRISLRDLDTGCHFRFKSRIYEKLSHRRTRCLCRRLSDDTLYTLPLSAPVMQLSS